MAGAGQVGRLGTALRRKVGLGLGRREKALPGRCLLGRLPRRLPFRWAAILPWAAWALSLLPRSASLFLRASRCLFAGGAASWWWSALGVVSEGAGGHVLMLAVTAGVGRRLLVLGRAREGSG